jgi:uncharacterized coiled-coil protein SlyX
MELDAQSLFTLGIVLSGLATTWGVTRTQLQTTALNITKMMKALHSLEIRLDDIESKEAVQESQLNTMSDILAPNVLRAQAETAGSIAERLKGLEIAVTALQSMHNHKHPPQGGN